MEEGRKTIYGTNKQINEYSAMFTKTFIHMNVYRNHILSVFYYIILSSTIIPAKAVNLTYVLWTITIILLFICSSIDFCPHIWKGHENLYDIQLQILKPIASFDNSHPTNTYYSPSLFVHIFALFVTIIVLGITVFYHTRKFLPCSAQIAFDVLCIWFCFTSVCVTTINCFVSLANYIQTTQQQRGICLVVPITSIIVYPICFIGILRSIFNLRITNVPLTSTNPRITLQWVFSILFLTFGHVLYLFPSFEQYSSELLLSLIIIGVSAYSIFLSFYAPLLNKIQATCCQAVSITFFINALVTFISILSPPNTILWGTLHIVSIAVSFIISVTCNIIRTKRARIFFKNRDFDETITPHQYYQYFSALSQEDVSEILTDEFLDRLFERFPINFELQIFIMRYIISDSSNMEANRATVFEMLEKNTLNYFNSTQCLILLELSSELSFTDTSAHKKRIVNSLYNSSILAHQKFWRDILRNNFNELKSIITSVVQTTEDIKATFRQLGINNNSQAPYGIAYINYKLNIAAQPYLLNGISIAPKENIEEKEIFWLTDSDYEQSDDLLIINATKIANKDIEIGNISESTASKIALAADKAGHKATIGSTIAFSFVCITVIASSITLLYIIITAISILGGEPTEINDFILSQDTLLVVADYAFWKMYRNTSYIEDAGIVDFDYIYSLINRSEVLINNNFKYDKKLQESGIKLCNLFRDFVLQLPNADFESIAPTDEFGNVTYYLTDYISECFTSFVEIRNEVNTTLCKYENALYKFNYAFLALSIISAIIAVVGVILTNEASCSLYNMCMMLSKPDCAHIYRGFSEFRDMLGELPMGEPRKTLKFHVKANVIAVFSLAGGFILVLVGSFCTSYTFDTIRSNFATVFSGLTVPFYKALVYQFARISFIKEDEDLYYDWLVFGIRAMCSIIGMTDLPSYITDHIISQDSPWNLPNVVLTPLTSDYLITEESNYSNEAFAARHIFAATMLQTMNFLVNDQLVYTNCQFKINFLLGNDTEHYSHSLINTCDFMFSNLYFIVVVLIIVYVVAFVALIWVCIASIINYRVGYSLIVRMITTLPLHSPFKADDQCILQTSGFKSITKEIVDAIPNGVIFYDKYGWATFANKAAEDAFKGIDIYATNKNDADFTSHVTDDGQTRFYDVQSYQMARFPKHPLDNLPSGSEYMIIRDITSNCVLRSRIEALERKRLGLRRSALPTTRANPQTVAGDAYEQLDSIAVVDIAVADQMSDDEFASIAEYSRNLSEELATLYVSETKRWSFCYIFSSTAGSEHQRQYLRDALRFARRMSKAVPGRLRVSIVSAESVFTKVMDSAQVGVVFFSDAFLRSSALLQTARDGEIVIEFNVLRRVTEINAQTTRRGVTVVCGREIEFCVIDHGEREKNGFVS